MALKDRISLTSTPNKRAVTEVAHISEAIISNVIAGRDRSEVETTLIAQAAQLMYAGFDLEISKYKQVNRLIAQHDYSPFVQGQYITTQLGVLTKETLSIATPVEYASLKLKRLICYTDRAKENASIQINDLQTGDSFAIAANLKAGYNSVPLERTIDADIFPLKVEVGIMGDGQLRLMAIDNTNTGGLVQRKSATTLTLQTAWELFVDAEKVMNAFEDDFLNALLYKTAVETMNAHLKSQTANKATTIDREGMIANRDELQKNYEMFLKGAVQNILPVIETKKATSNDIRIDVGYQVASIV